MEKKNRNLKYLLISILVTFSFANSLMATDNYVIAIRDSLKGTEWMSVVKELQRNHEFTSLLYYKESLCEILDSLRIIEPRYLCVVDVPEKINRDFVVEGNRMARSIDNDIYDDYLWGIITGYEVDDALRIARQSKEPFLIKSALSSTSEVSSGRWFIDFAWLDDGVMGKWGEKSSIQNKTLVYENEKFYNLLPIFQKKWEEIDPDFIITSSHATQNNLEMPFSSGNIKSKDGRLYANFTKPMYMPATDKPRVYFPVGNCLIGDINNSPQSMAVAWLSGGGATAMLGYVVSTWYGRNGWGALKYFLSNPNKFTLAEAAFLNRQDMLTQELRRNPKFLSIVPDFATYGDAARDQIEYQLGKLKDVVHNRDDLGFIYDRDVVVYYGDPAWNVKVRNPDKPNGYEFKIERKGKKHVITLKTDGNFSIHRVSGKGFKEVHVKDIPLAFYFPYSIKAPKLMKNKNELDIAFADNFLLIFNQNLEPNKTYKITLTEQVL